MPVGASDSMSHVIVTSLKPRNYCGGEWPRRSKRKEAPYAIGPQPVVLSARVAVSAVCYPGATDLAFDGEEGALEAEVVL